MVAASAELSARNFIVRIIGPGSAHEATRLAAAIKAEPAQILYDESGAVYDTYMLDKVLFSLLQETGAFVIDTQGTVRYALSVANPGRWAQQVRTELLAATAEA